MNYDELKMIWDSQNTEPLYAIDESALHARVKTESMSVPSSNQRWCSPVKHEVFRSHLQRPHLDQPHGSLPPRLVRPFGINS